MQRTRAHASLRRSPLARLPSDGVRERNDLEGRALIVTGTCGSGKTTVAELLALRAGWERVSEDDIWHERFGRDRGAFGTSEHRRKRRRVHEAVFAAVRGAVARGKPVVIDATVHESPPESFLEYSAFFRRNRIAWRLCVLHPRLEVAIARDSARSSWNLGPERVASLHAKFTGAVFPRHAFLDTSSDTPEETLRRVIAGMRCPPSCRRKDSAHHHRSWEVT